MTYTTTRYILNLAEHLASVAFGNDGPHIAWTTYWDLPLATMGLCYLSGNAGAWRLLIPGCHDEAIEEFRSVTLASIEPSTAIPGHIDIVAVDGTASPYCVTIGQAMIDRRISKMTCRLLVYTPAGLVTDIPVRVRT